MKMTRRIVTEAEVDACERCQKAPAEERIVITRSRLGADAPSLPAAGMVVCTKCLAVILNALAKRKRAAKQPTA